MPPFAAIGDKDIRALRPLLRRWIHNDDNGALDDAKMYAAANGIVCINCRRYRHSKSDIDRLIYMAINRRCWWWNDYAFARLTDQWPHESALRGMVGMWYDYMAFIRIARF